MNNDIPLRALDEADRFDRMDRNLKIWGAWSRAGGIPELWDSDPGPSGTILTRDDVELAWTLQLMINRLPVLYRLVLQVQYVLWRQAEREPWQEVNLRLAKLARSAFEQIPLISHHEYRPIRDRAVRMLINAEELMAPLARPSAAGATA